MQLISAEDWRAEARRALPRFVFDFMEGGAEEEVALRRNRSAFDDWFLLPRPLAGLSKIDLSVRIFGQTSQMPLMVAPTGLNGLIRPDGDQMLARAACAAGIPFILSTAANADVSTITKACGVAPWFQLYVADRARAEIIVDRAEAMEAPVLVLTVDVPVAGRRYRDIRNGFLPPFRANPRIAGHVVRRPGWLLRYLRHRDCLETPLLGGKDVARSKPVAPPLDATFDWDSLAGLRRRWKRPLVIKGLLRGEDALRAVDIGVDGIIVSNHGGRQLDAAPAPMDVLPEIVEVAGKHCVVLMDGGIRRGQDVLKALALGAKAVLVGRATLYGLAAQGEAGASRVLGQFRADLTRGLAMLGCGDFDALDNSRIRRAVSRPVDVQHR